MNDMTLFFPKGKTKALTLSYDDGVWQDRRLAGTLNSHGIKCTFNLNSKKALAPAKRTQNGVEIENIPADKINEVYAGHEIATHSFSHPFLTNMTDKGIYDEIHRDRFELEKITSGIVRGHAYPFGAYDDRVIRQLENNSITYARTVKSTDSFGFPRCFLEWHPTCHHKSPKLFETLDRFLGSNYQGLLFYLWGHSYEFDTDGNWDIIEKFCEKAGGRDDIWYAANMEIYDYIMAFRSLVISADGRTVHNPSLLDVCFMSGGKPGCVKSGETLSI